MMHRFFTRTILATLAVGLLFTGCKGPSKAGQRARVDAYDRVGRINSGIALEQADRYLRSGEFVDALKKVNGVLKSAPLNPDALILRGRTLQEMYRSDEAAASFRAALASDPSRADAAYYLGVIHERYGRLAEARIAYDEASCLDPRNMQYAVAGIETLVSQGELEAAAMRLDEVSTQFEFSHALMHLHAEIDRLSGNLDSAWTWLRRAQTLAPPSLYDGEIASLAFASRRYSACLSTLDDSSNKLLALEPEMIRLRARCLMMSGSVVEARDVMAKRVDAEASPTVEDWVVLGESAWMCADWARVREAGRQLVSHGDHLATGHIFLGAAAQSEGHVAEAARCYRRAQELDPTRMAPSVLLAQVQTQ